MNPTEQKAHTSRTQALAGELSALETLHLETARRVLEHERLHVQHKKDFDAHSVELMALRTITETHDRTLHETRLAIVGMLRDFLQRGFWGRLRWLLRGK